jgi:hypothetical protein
MESVADLMAWDRVWNNRENCMAAHAATTVDAIRRTCPRPWRVMRILRTIRIFMR